jgi:hypothetical protein
MGGVAHNGISGSRADEVAFFKRRLHEEQHALNGAERPEAVQHHGRLVARYRSVLQLYAAR